MKHTVELFSDYRLKAKIGKGTFGEVWSAINIETREKVAIKMSTTPKGPAILLAEYNMMNSLDHPNIIRQSYRAVKVCQ